MIYRTTYAGGAISERKNVSTITHATEALSLKFPY